MARWASVAAVVAGPAWAGVETRGATSCALSGYIDSRDPAGTNVRAAPGLGAPVIGRLPPPRAPGGVGEVVGPEFRIEGSRDGWLLIRDARQGGYGNDEVPVFSGPGWVAGGLVRFTLNDPALLSAPGPEAPVVLRLSGGAWGPDSVQVERVWGCERAYAEVSVRTPTGRRARGWVTRVCGNQVTTCP